HVGVDEDGDPMTTLAEAWLDRPKTDLLARRGVMAILCTRGRDVVQLLRFHSLAQPPKDKSFVELCGRWNPAAAPAPALPAAADPASAAVPTVAEAPLPEEDPELAALLEELNRPASAQPEAARNEPSPAPPEQLAEDQTDSEIAGLLAELTHLSSAAPPDAEPALPAVPEQSVAPLAERHSAPPPE